MGITPSLSPDGRRIAWYDFDAQQLVVQDLQAGTTRRLDYANVIRGNENVLNPYLDLPWTPDGSRIAVMTYQGDNPPFINVIDADTGDVVRVDVDGTLLGWLTPTSLLVLDYSSSDDVQTVVTVVEVRLDGSRQTLSSYSHTAGETDGFFAASGYALSPDGQTVAAVGEQDNQPVVFRLDVASGRLSSISCDGCTGVQPAHWATPTEILGSAGNQLVAVDVTTGEQRPFIAFSPRLSERTGAFALAIDVVSGGPASSPHLNTDWWGWYVDYISYGLTGLLAIVLVALWLRRRRARALLDPSGYRDENELF